MSKKSVYYDPGLTLPQVLRRAAGSPHQLFLGYFDKTCNLSVQTYKELLNEANHVAAGLFNLGLNQGDKIIIVSRNNKETAELLWGSFLLGLVPTILQPPANFADQNSPAVKLLNVFEQLDQPYIMMSEELKDAPESLKNKMMLKAQLSCTGGYPEPLLSPHDLAFIQFSSGSTGDPKGVMLTHNNLMVNMDAMSTATGSNYPDIWGSWMPLYHDMGLIGWHIVPIYCSVTHYLIETLDFVMNPGTWLNLMSREKVTISSTTNFGLALALKYLARGKQGFDWDFSRMKALLNGAEPISVKTMNDFVNSLIPYGFRPEAMMPVYGMAEATLAVAFAPLLKKSISTAFNAGMLDRKNVAQPVDPGDPSARWLSEVGFALNDFAIRIVDDHDHELIEGKAGHIQLSGSSVTQGYYKNPDATSSSFCGEWFRTGDIGFFYNGRLYISGRSKDIIFKNGMHYFANDLEELASTIDDIKFGKVCLSGTTDRESGEERVIAFIAGLSDEKAPGIFREMRTLLRSKLGISVDELALIRSNEIPKTSSGKIQRFKLMQRYLKGDFNDRLVRPEKGDYL